MTTMKTQYPEHYTTYVATKGAEVIASLESAVTPLENEQRTTAEYAEKLQSSIEIKRQLYRSHYSTQNAAILEKHCSDKDIIFVSAYTPMAIVSVTAKTIKEMARDPSIASISLYKNNAASVPPVSTIKTERNNSPEHWNLNSRAAYVRDTLGNKGAGVKIGQIEAAVPNVNDPYLSSANIITNERPINFGGTVDHATKVARIMVGTYGIAPLATLYSVNAYSDEERYSGIEWLLSQGVNVINMSDVSIGVYQYDALCAYVDRLAVDHDVHFVVATGNRKGGELNLSVCSPARAYNAIAVGAYDDNGTYSANDTQIYTCQHDDTIAYYSKYIDGYYTVGGDIIDPEGPAKPNLVATGNDFWGASGTSFAAPQVTGVIAQLCSYDSSLKTKQTSMGAILAASCGRKLLDEVQSNTVIVADGGFKGGLFTDDASVEGSQNQISDKQGAGKLDAYWARSIVASGNHWSVTLLPAQDIYQKTVYITKGSNTLTRIALYWLKSDTVYNWQNNLRVVDWDIRVYAPDGTPVGDSLTSTSNFEIVQFVPPVSGTYTIEISRVESNFSDKTYAGIAVW